MSDSPADFENPERKSPRLVRSLPIILASLAILGFVGVVWYAYQQGQSGHYEEVVPTIRAEFDEMKTKPDDPGGMNIPNQDKLIFQQVEEGTAERLYGDEGAPPAMISEEDAESGATSVDETSANLAAALEESAQEVVTESAAPSTVEPVVSAPPEEPAVKAEEPAPVVRAKEPKTSVKPASAGGVYRVQFASVKTREAADSARSALLPQLKSALGDQELFITEADLGAKGTYYRVQAGEYSSKEEAKALCDAFKASQGGSCLIVKR